ncbi:MAG: enoyl-CoA hydratase/isomerase family protein [Geminicoccales bacterium]
MDTLLTERHGEVLVVQLNRPERRNAIDMRLLAELRAVLHEAESDAALRALVVTGDERAFCAGQDLKEEEPPEFVAEINAVFNQLEALPMPTVAAIDGWCLAGGLELALTCDLRVAATEAKIGDWHANINSIGGAGATVRLVRLLGLTRAKELVFTGAALDAEQARAFGLVSYCYPRAELRARAVEHARAMCKADPLTVRYAKRSLHAAADLSLAEALDFSLICQERVRLALDENYAASFARGRKDKPGRG